MADERLRRRLADAFDPGPGFPSSSLLSRTLAGLDRELVSRRRRHAAMTAIGAAAVLVAAAGLFQLRTALIRQTPSPGAAPPSAETVAALPAAGPGVAAIFVARPGADASVYVSDDGGRTWRRLLPLHARQHWFGLYVRFFGGGQWVVLADGLYSTDDGGAHWRQLALPDGANRYQACFATAGEGWLLGGVPAGGPGLDQPLYHSADGGRTWALVARANSDHGVSFTETVWDLMCQGRGWAGVVTTDSAGAVAVHATGDGGATWQRTSLPSGGRSTSLMVGNVACSEDGRAVVPVFSLGPLQTILYTTADGGRTWNGPLAPALPMTVGYGGPPDLGVTAAGGGWWAVNGDRLALSRDGGRSWGQHHIDLPGGYRAVSAEFTDLRTGLVVATDSPLFQTPPP